MGFGECIGVQLRGEITLLTSMVTDGWFLGGSNGGALERSALRAIDRARQQRWLARSFCNVVGCCSCSPSFSGWLSTPPRNSHGCLISFSKFLFCFSGFPFFFLVAFNILHQVALVSQCKPRLQLAFEPGLLLWVTPLCAINFEAPPSL